MLVKDPDLLRRLMEAKGLSSREISRQMGWGSHSYFNRVLAGRVPSVTTDAAVKIAYLLQVPVDLIFVARVSGDSRQVVQRRAS